MMAGDQVLLRIDIRPIKTGIEELRSRYPHMYSISPGFFEQRNDAFTCRSPYNRIIDQYNILVFYYFLDSRQFDFYLVKSVPGGNKSPADIFVFNKAYAIGNPGFSAVAERSIKPGIGSKRKDAFEPACSKTPLPLQRRLYTPEHFDVKILDHFIIAFIITFQFACHHFIAPSSNSMYKRYTGLH
jgi:hypothetical protein